MRRYSANLSILWPELEVYDRFRAASEVGFREVELGVIGDLDLDRLKHQLANYSQRLMLFNPDPGTFADGELGFLGVPGREADFNRAVDRALDIARDLGVPMLNTLVGVAPDGVSAEQAEAVAVRNLNRVAPLAAAAGVTLLIEPVNSVDVPGYVSCKTDDGVRLVETVNQPNVRLLFDLYHAAVEGEDPIELLDSIFPLLGHVHIADFPGRHEPGTGLAPISMFITELDRLGYEGLIGLEYSPAGDTRAGLAWLRAVAP